MMDVRQPLLPARTAAAASPRALRLPKRSFAYPLIGIALVFIRPSLHAHVASRILPLMLLSLVVMAFMFTFIYIPHVIVLSLLHHNVLVFGNAALMVLSESSVIIALLAEAWFTERQTIDIFDTVFLEETAGVAGLDRRCQEMVRAVRVVDIQVTPDDYGRHPKLRFELGDHRIDPFVKLCASLRLTFYFLVELPLNLVPVFGTTLFLCLQGLSVYLFSSTQLQIPSIYTNMVI
jgi:hypothetical protein